MNYISVWWSSAPVTETERDFTSLNVQLPLSQVPPSVGPKRARQHQLAESIGKRKRTKPRRYEDEVWVPGSGAVQRKGYDGTDMSFKG